GNLALLANQQRDFAAARRRLDEALPYHQAALQANPRHPTYRQFYRNNLRALTASRAAAGDRSAAVAATRQMRGLGWGPPAVTSAAARALGRCASIVEKDEKLDTAKRLLEAAKRLVEVKFYGDEAMAMLRDAIRKGYKDVERMKEDKNLAPLRGRDDFK